MGKPYNSLIQIMPNRAARSHQQDDLNPEADHLPSTAHRQGVAPVTNVIDVTRSQVEACSWLTETIQRRLKIAMQVE